MLIPEKPSNRSPGLSELVIREEKPSPLPVGRPAESLPHLTQHHYAVVDPGFLCVLFLTSSGGPALPGITLRLSVPHQACVETSLPEVHTPIYLCLYFPGFTYAQLLCENDMGKNERSPGVPTPDKTPLPLRNQYDHKPAPK